MVRDDKMITQATTPELILTIPADLTDMTVELVFQQYNRTIWCVK